MICGPISNNSSGSSSSYVTLNEQYVPTAGFTIKVSNNIVTITRQDIGATQIKSGRVLAIS